MNRFRFTWLAVGLTFFSAWLAGTSARVAGLLGRDELMDPGQLVALIVFFQRVDIPISIWASLPICACVSYFGDVRGRHLAAFVLTVLLGGAVSILLIYLLGRSSTSPGGIRHQILMELPYLVAFHITPAIVVLTSCIVFGSAARWTNR